ncbi:MFS transporter [Oricola sp.]|uniref:MFS transporter n=1 Tax=Oricola sp. TaxID=1979950 RepID=UPI0025FB5CE8|nr:MFS transporter [Oricola sp.]MCI5078178.1 MFS transporter [Oricola sp.]
MNDSSAPAATPRDDAPAPIGFATTMLFAVACGALAGNLYYAQPLVALIAQSMGLSTTAESLIFTAAQFGYAIGLLFLVPLGDLFENRRLILAVMVMNVASLAGLALAPGLSTLFAMILVVGFTSTAAQVIVPLAASLAPAARRGAVVGNVMTGLFVGILLARPASSFIADHLGWRGVFALSAVLVTGLTIWGAFAIPRRVPQARHAYLRLIGSLAHLMATEPVLRRRTAYQTAMFSAFTVFWTASPIVLLRQGYTPSEIALFALAGVSGVFAAPVAGRMADRGFARPGTAVAIGLGLITFLIAWISQANFWALMVAGVLIDFGVQGNMVLSQRELYQLDEAIRSRLTAAYMTTFFLGGAVASALTSPVLTLFGWTGICLLGGLLPLTALAYFAVAERRG